jgi:branched-chain amino acid transport system ATP-binding protein
VTLSVSDLSVDYGGGDVVRGVNFTVGSGELVALVGPNGAGKTSILNAILGFAPATAGTIVHDSVAFKGSSPNARARQGVALVPEDRGLFSAMSVHDHLWLGLHARPGRKDLDEVFELFPQLQGRLHQKAGALSGGEAQMLAIAMAILLKPKTLLIDELSFGLAPLVVEQLLQRCVALAHRDQIAVLVVEQFVELVLAVADRAIVLSHGEIKMSDSAASIRERSDELRAAYLG